MNTPLNTIEGIDSALTDLFIQIREYMKNHGVDYAIETTYSKQAQIFGMEGQMSKTKSLSLKSVNKNNDDIIGMMGIEMCPVSNGMEVELLPFHVLNIQNTRRYYEQYLRDGQFPPEISEEAKSEFIKMKREGITGEQYEKRSMEQAEHMMRTESWKFGGAEETLTWRGEELGFRVVDNAKFQDFLQGISMIRPGEYNGIVDFVQWLAYILEEEMKYHFFQEENGTEDLLSVYSFLPQILELIQKHNLAQSSLNKYVMHMKRKTVREYVKLMKAGYDFHAMPASQPLLETLNASCEDFKVVMKDLATVINTLESNKNTQSMIDDARWFTRNLITSRQRKFPEENLGEVRNMFE